jgi:glutamine amidotransferase
MIGIVDYGLGNVQAIANIYKLLSIDARIVSDAEELRLADRLILPGVGAFDWAMTRLEASGLRSALNELVNERARPVLGICVGMQMMANSSEEGTLAGLGWIQAVVKKLPCSAADCRTPLPHMGWNDVEPVHESSLFAGLAPSARFYFLHSYAVFPEKQSIALATTRYCGDFVSSVAEGNVFGVQFHPEKGHAAGVSLLRNFANLS